MPRTPVATKDVCQPKLPISQVTSGKDSAEPMREPLSKMLLARARSLRGNQLAATLAQEG